MSVNNLLTNDELKEVGKQIRDLAKLARQAGRKVTKAEKLAQWKELVSAKIQRKKHVSHMVVANPHQ